MDKSTKVLTVITAISAIVLAFLVSSIVYNEIKISSIKREIGDVSKQLIIVKADIDKTKNEIDKLK